MLKIAINREMTMKPTIKAMPRINAGSKMLMNRLMEFFKLFS